MKFGKLPDISGVDFSLPTDHPFTSRFLEKQSAVASPKIYIGCTGWSMKEWVGTVYPKGTKAKDYLKQYAKSFHTIEFNTTHYRTPSPSSVQKWKSESTEEFRFCPKVLQQISHRKELGMDNDLLTVWLETIHGLGNKIGSCFMQLPPYFGADRLPLLVRFLQTFPREIPLAIELRHPSWFVDQQVLSPLLEVLEELNMGLVITDVAGRRDVLHMAITCPRVLVRFVGNDLVPSDYNRIDDWVQRIDQWTSKGVQEIYFFPHEPDNIKAPEMALYLAEQLAEKTKLEVLIPNLSGVETDGGIQGSLF